MSEVYLCQQTQFYIHEVKILNGCIPRSLSMLRYVQEVSEFLSIRVNVDSGAFESLIEDIQD